MFETLLIFDFEYYIFNKLDLTKSLIIFNLLLIVILTINTKTKKIAKIARRIASKIVKKIV